MVESRRICRLCGWIGYLKDAVKKDTMLGDKKYVRYICPICEKYIVGMIKKK